MTLNYEIISEFISCHLESCSTYNDCINNLNKLAKFFEDHNYSPDLDIYIQLVKQNSLIQEMLKLIIKEYGNESKSVNDIFDNDIITMLIEIYCQLNDTALNTPVPEDTEEDEFESLDSDKLYFREIKRIPLLTKEESIKLADRVAHNDEEARDEFIQRNLPLVVNVAKRYIGNGLDLMDLIQYGTEGLIEAVDKFDISKGFKLSTYAYFWIKKKIMEALKKDGIKRWKAYPEQLRMYKKTVDDLEVALRRKPTIEEIAERMNMQPLQVAELESASLSPTSLNQPIKGNCMIDLLEFIKSPDDTPEDIVLQQLDIQEMFAQAELSEREIIVLRKHFGLSGMIRMSLTEIACQFGVSEERVRQIKNSALKKLRQILTENNGEGNKYIDEIKPKLDEIKPKLIEHFKRYSETELDVMVKKLSDDDVEELYDIFQEDPSKKSNLPLFRCMKRMLENPNHRRNKSSRRNRATCQEENLDKASDANEVVGRAKSKADDLRRLNQPR